MRIFSDKFEANGKAYHFLSPEQLKDSRYSLYLYIHKSDDENKFYAKFGEAKDQTVWDRYAPVTGCIAHKRMVAVWESDKSDSDIHPYLKEMSENKHGFKWAGKKNENAVNTEEAYELLTEDALEKLIGFIKEKTNCKHAARRSDPAYQDVQDLAGEICDSVSAYYILDLCARWGKTRTILEVMKKWNIMHALRICVMTAYVKTVRRSYSDNIQKYEQYENCRFFDPDDYCGREDALEAEMREWLADPAHYCMFYVALTGAETEDDNTCFKRRINVLKKFKKLKSMIVVEEEDFGSHCDNQVKKIQNIDRMLEDCITRIATTGTNAERGLNIFDIPPKYIKRDYMLDVLGSPCRPNAVNIKWNVLNNAGMVKNGLARPAEMENWSAMLAVGEDGHLREKMYLRQFFSWLFKPESLETSYFSREAIKLRDKIIDDRYATMLFTSVGNATHKAIENLLKKILDPSWRIIVLDGDAGVTNADAEERVKNAFKGHDDNKVIVISSGMGNRSFSVPEIKNIVLLTDGGSYASIAQKTARGLTPLNEASSCNIIDCRFNYAQDKSNLSVYLSQLGIDAFSGGLTENNENTVIEKILATGKIIFNEYFGAGQQPVRALLKEDLYKIMQTRDFKVAKAQYVFSRHLDEVREPRICGFRHEEGNAIEMLANGNIQGDGDQKIMVKGGKKGQSQIKNADESAENKKEQHLLFLLNHPEFFNTYRFRNGNITLQEFKSMSRTRIDAYEKTFGVDMNTMADIVKLLDGNGIDPVGSAQSK